MIDVLIKFGRFDRYLMVMKDPLGPYISCHVLSLFENININKDNFFVGCVVNI